MKSIMLVLIHWREKEFRIAVDEPNVILNIKVTILPKSYPTNLIARMLIYNAGICITTIHPAC